MFRSLSCPPLVPEFTQKCRTMIHVGSPGVFEYEWPWRQPLYTALKLPVEIWPHGIFHFSLRGFVVSTVCVPFSTGNKTQQHQICRRVLEVCRTLSTPKTESDRTHTAPPRLCEWQWRNHPKLFPIHRRYCICIDRYSKEKENWGIWNRSKSFVVDPGRSIAIEVVVVDCCVLLQCEREL